MIVYSYRRALIRRCAKPFNLFSTEKSAHVCNTALVKKHLKVTDLDADADEQGEDVIIGLTKRSLLLSRKLRRRSSSLIGVLKGYRIDSIKKARSRIKIGLINGSTHRFTNTLST
jgi:hypothetical protein